MNNPRVSTGSLSGSEREGADRLEAWGRWYRPTMLGVSLLLVMCAAAIWMLRWQAFDARGYVGIDHAIWVGFGESWLATGTPYQRHQLEGPYDAYNQTLPTANLYPPPFALVCVALTRLPAVLWWAVPIGLIGWLVVSWRPAPWTWPLLALGLAWPTTASMVIAGNTALPIAALVGAGLRWGWPAPLILLKPTFAPFALVGIRSSSWWVSAVLLAAVSLAMLPLWTDYLAALQNASGMNPLGIMEALPLVAVPLVAWAGRTR